MRGKEMTIIENKTLDLEFSRRSSKVIGALSRLKKYAYDDGVISSKIKILTALTIAVVTKCESCIRSYIKLVYEKGVTKDELVEILNVSIAMQGCVGHTWALKAYHEFLKLSNKTSNNDETVTDIDDEYNCCD